jgi:hypothetical protein
MNTKEKYLKYKKKYLDLKKKFDHSNSFKHNIPQIIHKGGMTPRTEKAILEVYSQDLQDLKDLQDLQDLQEAISEGYLQDLENLDVISPHQLQSTQSSRSQQQPTQSFKKQPLDQSFSSKQSTQSTHSSRSQQQATQSFKKQPLDQSFSSKKSTQPTQPTNRKVIVKSSKHSGKVFDIPEEYKPVKMKRNDGSKEGMINQCFWISILDYLQKNGNPGLRLRELRTYAGLDSSTETIPFVRQILFYPRLT